MLGELTAVRNTWPKDLDPSVLAAVWWTFDKSTAQQIASVAMASDLRTEELLHPSDFAHQEAGYKIFDVTKNTGRAERAFAPAGSVFELADDLVQRGKWLSMLDPSYPAVQVTNVELSIGRVVCCLRRCFYKSARHRYPRSFPQSLPSTTPVGVT